MKKEKPKQVWEQIIVSCGGKEEFMKSAGLLPKHETLKEASENYAEKVFNDRPNLDNDSKIWLVGGSIEGFKEGAKWQQERSYSEEEERFIERLICFYWIEYNNEHPCNLKEFELSKSILEKQFKNK